MFFLLLGGIGDKLWLAFGGGSLLQMYRHIRAAMLN